ncbi:MAG: glycine/betaine ABC transporter substrate-binding protein [Propionibacteriales bacterium]|nr:glycine/betaine ABC transporter substrate-binding protein [Propionibacteriales bacterium]
MRVTRTIRNIALGLVFGFLVAACGEDATGEGPLAGQEFTIGTKGFTEHFILAQMTRHRLEDAGASVDVRDLPATAQVRKALLNDEIQLYWEYTGTAWTNFLGHDSVDPNVDPGELYQQVAADDLEENGVRWMEPATFNNTYAIVMGQEVAEDLGVTTLSELAELQQPREADMTLCVDTTFAEREDGLAAVERTYDFEWPRELVTSMDYAIVFASVAEGECNFGEVYATEPRIEELDLVILEDEANAFISYLPAITMLDETYQESGRQIEELVAPIVERLDTETIIGLNARVDLDGQRAEDVAQDWLEEEGLL